MDEEWRAVAGYEGVYEVSDHGRVRSVDRKVRTAAGTRKARGRILRPGAGDAGHLHVGLWRDNKMANHLVHRLVATAFIGAPEPGMNACHNDGDPSNNHVENIRWDSQAGNIADKRLHGTDYQSNKTHCPQGHEYSPDNTYPEGGGRRCATCAKARANARYVRHPRVVTHCVHGHEFTEANTYVDASRPGSRTCRACRAERERARRARVTS